MTPSHWDRETGRERLTRQSMNGATIAHGYHCTALDPMTSHSGGAAWPPSGERVATAASTTGTDVISRLIAVYRNRGRTRLHYFPSVAFA